MQGNLKPESHNHCCLEMSGEHSKEIGNMTKCGKGFHSSSCQFNTLSPRPKLE